MEFKLKIKQELQQVLEAVDESAILSAKTKELSRKKKSRE